MRRVLLLGGIAVAASANAIEVLYDIGAPHMVNFNGNETYLGFTSGNSSATTPQRWSAIPFTVPSTGWLVTQVDVDYFLGTPPSSNVEFIIWERTGLDAPTTMSSSGTLGPAGTGIDDPRVPETEDWLHQYAVSWSVAPGDYYFTVYGSAPAGFNSIAWLTGGDLQDEAVEQDFMWRSSTFPAPGFVVYAPGTILPGAGMTDVEDRWNTSFTFHGEPIPEPATLVALVGALGLLAARRRR